MKKRNRIVTILLLICFWALVVIWFFYQKNMDQGQFDHQIKNYKKHYLMIADNKDSSFWQTIYESAVAQADQYDSFIEYIMPGSNPAYSLADCLRIAIASKVDGVIVHPDGSEEIKDLINEAYGNSIPVVTVMDDATESSRVSFVGLNNYLLADAYTEQVLSLLKPGNTKILLLSSDPNSDSRVRLIYSQMVKAIEQKKNKDQTVSIKEYTAENTKEFNMEEVIRDLIIKESTRPDVIICTEEFITECTYQTLIDYSLVGDISIIGFYYSDHILDAVEKENINSTIALDASEIGNFAVNALEEYHTLGNTSTYYSVGLNVITKENVSDFLNKKGGTE